MTERIVPTYGDQRREIERLRSFLELIRRLPSQSDLSAASDLGLIGDLCTMALETSNNPPDVKEVLA